MFNKIMVACGYEISLPDSSRVSAANGLAIESSRLSIITDHSKETPMKPQIVFDTQNVLIIICTFINGLNLYKEK